MNKVQDLLTPTLKQLGLKKRYSEESIFVHWQEIVGPEIAKHAWPSKIERGNMLVQVTNSVWCHHLSMMKENIIIKVNQFISEKLILDIRFQAGKVHTLQNEESKEYNKYLFFKSSGIILDRHEIAAIEEFTAQVNDIDLRIRLATLLKKESKLKKFKNANQWHTCGNCSVLCPPEQEFCTACSLKKRHIVLEQIRTLLMEAPWLKYHEIVSYIPCYSYEFDHAKTDLILRLVRELQVDEKEVNRVQLITLTMLITCIKPEAITDDFLTQTLQKIRRKTYVHTPRG